MHTKSSSQNPRTTTNKKNDATESKLASECIRTEEKTYIRSPRQPRLESRQLPRQRQRKIFAPGALDPVCGADDLFAHVECCEEGVGVY